MYFIRLTGLFLFIVLSLQISAQKITKNFSLSGIVTDASGIPLPGTSIYISDLRKGAIADISGAYKIENIPPGQYIVSAEHTGFHTSIQSLQFDRDRQLNFKLEVTLTEEKEVVITSALQATSIKRNPIPVVNVTKDFLRQSLSANIINAISGVPGVSAVTTGPNVAKPFIRGLGFNRILTLFDGVRQEGQQWGDEHGVEIDENSVERVEIIKGPASLLYGSDAIGGVVNFIPLRLPPSGARTGSASVTYQTNNNMLVGSAGMGSNIKDFSWQATATHKMAADYQNKVDGRVYNTGFSESSVFLQGALSKRWGYSRMGISYYDNKQEIPESTRDSASRRFMKENEDEELIFVSDKELKSYKISDVYQRIQHFRIYNTSNFSVGNGKVGSQLGFQKNIRREFEDPQTEDAALFLDLNTLTYDLKYFVPQINHWTITPGINGMYQWNHSGKGYEFLIPDYNQFDAGPFIYAKLSHKKSELAGGVRYDVRHFENKALYVIESGGKDIPVFGMDTVGAEKIFSGYKNTFGGLSGSLGFTYIFNHHWNIKANVARGYRAPNIAEISSNGIHSGSKIYQLGNEGLKPEFSFQQDVEATYHEEHVTLKGSVFNNQIRNYIFNQKLVTVSGQDSVIVPGYETFGYTSSRAHLYGGEFLIDIHPHPLDWLHFENTVSVVFAKNVGFKGQQISEEEKYLPFIPPVHGKTELRANFEKIKNLQNLYLKVQMDWYAAQDRVFSLNQTETPTPGYQLFNIGAGTDINTKRGTTFCTINLMAVNILNTAYQSHLSRLKYFEDYPDDPRGYHGIYNMGRAISIKISVPFSF